jgi:hypothetical protein
MHRWNIAFALFGSILLLTACGGDSRTPAEVVATQIPAATASASERILKLNGYDQSEGSVRANLRAGFVSNLLGASLVCRGVEGLRPADAVTYIRTIQGMATPGPSPTLLPVQTPRPGQNGALDDGERAAVIVQEECARLFPSPTPVPR